MYTELRIKLRTHKKIISGAVKGLKVSDFHTKAGHNPPAFRLIKSNSMLQREKGNDFRDLNLSVWHQAPTLPRMKSDMCVKYPTEAGKLERALQQQNQRTISIAVTSNRQLQILKF